MSLFKIFKLIMLDQFMFYGGGGKGGGSAPSYPDPNVVANATTQTNEATAAYNKALNLGNNNTSFGSTQTVQTGVDPNTGAPIYSTNVTANGNLQNLQNGAISQAGQAGSINAGALAGLQGLQSQYSGLNSGLTGLQGQYSGLNSSLNGLQSQYAGLNSGLSGIQNQYAGLNSGIAGLGSQYSNLSGQLANINSSINLQAGAQAQQNGQNAAYAAQTQYLDPQFAQQQESLNNSLANQGLAPGSQAYNNAQLNQSNAKQQAYSNAANQAVLTGSTIGQQSLNNQLNAANTQAGLVNQQGSMVNNQAGLFGLQGSNLSSQAGIYGQQGANLNSQAGVYGQEGSNLGAQAGIYGQQSSNLGQQATNYGQQSGIGQLGYSNLGSISSLIPGYTGSANASAAPADIASQYNNQYQSQLAGYNSQQQSANATQSGLFGLGSAGILASFLSDRRTKRSIKRVATWPNGLGVYTYRYVWEGKGVRHLGFMADEVRKIAPHAVSRGADGFDRVNYRSAA